MLKLTFDAGDWQFIEKQKVMEKELDLTNGSGVSIDIFADKPVRVILETPEGEHILLAEGQRVALDCNTRGFSKLLVHAPPESSYAAKVFVTFDRMSEHNTGQQVVLEPSLDRDARIDIAVQKQLIRELAAQGFNRDDIGDLLSGLNSDEDLDFDDEDDLPTEAEMEEMIIEAQRQGEEEEILDVDDDEPPVDPPVATGEPDEDT